MTMYDLYPEFNPQEVYESYLHDLKKSAKGEKTSHQFIINQLTKKEMVKEQEVVQVLTVGGTFCSSAKVKAIHDAFDILELINIPKPAFPTKESFLSFISSVTQCDKVVINSADTIKPTFRDGKMDGIFLISSKENKMEGLVGEKIGEEVEKYILQKTGKNVDVYVANDTVCLLLSGLTKYAWKTIAGGIVGTGTNIAFFMDENCVVNLEAGDYNTITSSEPGKKLNITSEEPGRYLSEKETSGAYLYKHFNYFVRKYSIDYSSITSTAMVSEISSQDIPEISGIAQLVLQHSAKFVGSQIAALVKYLERDTIMVMQGSLFWKADRYKEEVEKIMKELVPEYTVNFVSITDADVLGGAKVIL